MLRFFDCSCTVSSHRARSFRPYMKGKNVLLTGELDCVSVLCRNPSGQPDSCGEQHRGTSRSVDALCTSPRKHHCFMRGTKTLLPYVWTWILRCGININEGLVLSFKLLHIKWVSWDLQNFFHCLKNRCHWCSFPANLQKMELYSEHSSSLRPRPADRKTISLTFSRETQWKEEFSGMKRAFLPYQGELCSVSNVEHRLHSVILIFFHPCTRNLNGRKDG